MHSWNGHAQEVYEQLDRLPRLGLSRCLAGMLMSPYKHLPGTQTSLVVLQLHGSKLAFWQSLSQAFTTVSGLSASLLAAATGQTM